MPFETAIGNFDFLIRAALGAAWVGWVGNEADVTKFDPIANETVRINPAAGAVEVRAPIGVFAAVRIEEGTVHGGEVEVSEARAGWEEKQGRFSAWVGRSDVPVTLDRRWESEELGLSWRPVLSRTSLPLHAVGFGVGTGFRFAHLDVGVMYAALNADAPWGWASADLVPVGVRPEDNEAPVEKPCLVFGLHAAGLASPTLGQQWLLSGDVDVRWRTLAVEAGVIAYDHDVLQDEVFVGVATRIVPFPDGSDLHVRVRAEAARHLEEDEDLRWIVEPRLAWRSPKRRLIVYVEAFGSREQGTPVDTGEDVVDAGRGIERSNDVVMTGLQVRL